MNILPNISIGSKWSLTARDWAQGAVMAAIGAVGSELYSIAIAWYHAPNWGSIDWPSLSHAAKGAVFSAGVYLVKRYMQKPDVIITHLSEGTLQALKENSQAIAAVNTPGPI